jgi:hypothetical protein
VTTFITLVMKSFDVSSHIYLQGFKISLRLRTCICLVQKLAKNSSSSFSQTCFDVSKCEILMKTSSFTKLRTTLKNYLLWYSSNCTLN